MQRDKFTPIHNDVLESLARINLSPYEWRVLCVILRKTYGFEDKSGKRKKNDWIAQSQISKSTGLDRRLISRSIKGLVTKGVISRDDKKLGLSKRFMSSVEMTNVIPSDDKSVISRDDKKPEVCHQFCNLVSSVEMHTKETNTKDIVSKDTTGKQKKSKIRLQDIRDLVEHYKKLKKVDKDPSWNSTFFKHYAKRASDLIGYLGNLPDAIECMNDRVAYLEKIKYSWAFETIIKYAQDWKRDRKQNLEAETKRKQETAQAAEFAKKNME